MSHPSVVLEMRGLTVVGPHPFPSSPCFPTLPVAVSLLPVGTWRSALTFFVIPPEPSSHHRSNPVITLHRARMVCCWTRSDGARTAARVFEPFPLPSSARCPGALPRVFTSHVVPLRCSSSVLSRGCVLLTFRHCALSSDGDTVGFQHVRTRVRVCGRTRRPSETRVRGAGLGLSAEGCWEGATAAMFALGMQYWPVVFCRMYLLS